MTDTQDEKPEKPPEAIPPEERGDKPWLAEGPTFELAGHTHTMRRLNYQDHSRFAGILQQALRHGKFDLVGAASRGEAAEQMQVCIQVLLGALTYAPSELFGFLASVLEVDRPTIFDPQRFPFASLPMVIVKLKEHPDLQDFFAELGAMINQETSTPTPPTAPSSGQPTSLPDATETPTSKS